MCTSLWCDVINDAITTQYTTPYFVVARYGELSESYHKLSRCERTLAAAQRERSVIDALVYLSLCGRVHSRAICTCAGTQCVRVPVLSVFMYRYSEVCGAGPAFGVHCVVFMLVLPCDCLLSASGASLQDILCFHD